MTPQLIIERVLHERGCEHSPIVATAIIEELREHGCHLVSDAAVETRQFGERERYRIHLRVDDSYVEAVGERTLHYLVASTTDLRPMLNARIGEDVLRLLGRVLKVPGCEEAAA